MSTDKPEIVTDEHLLFLDDLRESGVVNMYRASSYIQEKFGVNIKNAKIILTYWMKTFSERNPIK